MRRLAFNLFALPCRIAAVAANKASDNPELAAQSDTLVFVALGLAVISCVAVYFRAKNIGHSKKGSFARAAVAILPLVSLVPLGEAMFRPENSVKEEKPPVPAPAT